MSKIIGELDASIQAKLESDTEFQATLKDLSDDEKKQKFDEKKEELLDQELSTIREKATKAEKAEELATNYKKRAEKAEGELKGLPKDSQDGLSNKDVLYLAKADIHEDDLDEVLEYARFKKVPVNDAHKQYKAVLDIRAEERKTAAATAAGKGGARGASKVTGEDLLRKAEQTGEVPTDPDKMRELAEARIARKKAKFANRGS